MKLDIQYKIKFIESRMFILLNQGDNNKYIHIAFINRLNLYKL